MNVSLERPIHVARLSGPRLTHPRWEKRPMFPRRWDDKSDKWVSAWYGSQDTGGEASGCVDFDYSFFAGSFFSFFSSVWFFLLLWSLETVLFHSSRTP